MQTHLIGAKFALVAAFAAPISDGPPPVHPPECMAMPE